MNRSRATLQDTFTSTWGFLYSRNSQLFHDLYQDLRDYYRSASVNLEEVLNEFWTKLLEKLFYQANKQSSIGMLFQQMKPYLCCSKVCDVECFAYMNDVGQSIHTESIKMLYHYHQKMHQTA